MPFAIRLGALSAQRASLRARKTTYFFIMDTEPLYCAEQIKVPEGLPELLRLFSKEVIRAQPPPEKLYEWAAQ